MAGRNQRGRGRGRGRGFGPGGRGSGGRGTSRGRGLGYASIRGIDTLPFYPTCRVDAPSGPAGKVENSDLYNSRHPTPLPTHGSSFQRDSSEWDGHTAPDLLGLKEDGRKCRLESKPRHGDASLSQCLYKDRPLLKPVSFVRSRYAPTLFLKEEEILQPVAEEAGEQETNHGSTAERIYRIFRGGDTSPNSSESPSGSEGLLEIDFADLGRFMDEAEAIGDSSRNATSTRVEEAESQSAAKVEDRFTGVCVNTSPSPVHGSTLPANQIAVKRSDAHRRAEDIDEDDEIVYVAPHPRNGKLVSGTIQSSSAAAAAFASVAETGLVATLSYPETDPSPYATSFSSQPVPKASSPLPAAASLPSRTSKDTTLLLPRRPPRPTYQARWPGRTARRRREQHATFSSFGALQAEASLRELDPWRDEQRHGDSDIDWGGSTSEECEQKDGMIVDQDLDVGAMKAFVGSMSAARQAHVSAGDIEDEARIWAEEFEEGDEESTRESDDSEDELELAVDVWDMLVPAKDGGTALATSPVEDENESNSDEEETPKRSFQARLNKLRGRTEGRPIQDVLREELDQEPGVDESDHDTADEEDIIAQIQNFLDENGDILRPRDRGQRNRIFKAIRNGAFEIDSDIADRRKKETHIPEELHHQWVRDRAKKAERKRLRALERTAVAADPFAFHKGGTKSRKAGIAAALAVPMDLETVVKRMRRFVADINGTNTLSLPSMDREMRKSVHELATAFKLKSKSRGTGVMRFTTLMKTSHSGGKVDEKKIARILRGSPSSYVDRRNKGGAGKRRLHDGEVVGEAAPKLDGSNRGFRMLSAMGWEEGSRIGVDGGLEAPLVAVIKTTKLGLGARL